MTDYGIEIGTANYFGNRKRNFKLEAKKPNIFRILPPLGEAAKRGLWLVPYAVHWGDKGSDGKMKPYLCIQKMEKLPDGSKRVTKRCPRCEKNAKVKDARDTRAASFKAKGVADNLINEKLKAIDDYLRQFNRGYRHYANGLNTEMQIGRVDMPDRHANQLREAIANLLKNGIDATAPAQGVFFNFFYEGKDGHSVTPVTEAGSQAGSLQLKMAPLTENILRSLKAESWNLMDLFTSLTEEQIQRLVDNEGNSEVVDNVFSSGTVSSTPVTNAAASSIMEDTKFDDGLDAIMGTSSSSAALAPATASNAVSGVAATGTVQNTAGSVAVKVSSVPPAAPAPAPAANIASMSDADFESQFGI